MPTLNLKIIPVPPAIFLGDFADLNSFRGINPDAPPKEGLEASEGHIEGHKGRPSKRGASWSLRLVRYGFSRKTKTAVLWLSETVFVLVLFL